MRKRIFLLLVILLSALAVGLVFGQEAPAQPFELMTELGQVRPRGILYDSNFDRFVWTDPRGRLLLVDAKTLETQHTLYETGFYNAYKFSHNRQYLALAIDIRVEIFDTNTGELLLTFTPDGALRAEAPLFWSQDDTLLSFNTQVRAPREVRRSENDTTNLPWVWDIASEFGERLSILPNARAIPFFDYRNGFVFGEHMKAVVGMPERLRVLDITPNGTEIIGEIPANRFEPDPIIVWSSLRDDMLYVHPDNNSSIMVQVDTEHGTLLDLPIGRDLTYGQFAPIENIVFSDQWRIIGQPLATVGNSFLRLLLGSNYEAQFGYNPITVQLIDILEPETPAAGETLFLLYIYDEARDVGRLDLILPQDVNQIVLHPDGNHLMVRRASGFQRIEVYDLDSGLLEHSYLPTLPDAQGTTVLAYNATGETIVSDFQRFDAETGEILFEELNYNYGFGEFYWNDNSQTLITMNGNQWWEWDIHTGEIIRREQVNLIGDLMAVSPDAERFLTRIEGGAGIEIVEIGMEERPRIVFDNLPDVRIEQVIPSPDWENFLVVYSVNSNGQHSPGNEIMLFNMDNGVMWHMASDDLPPMNGRSYGWVNNDTVYIYGQDGTNPPQRIYGIDYTASGVPQCLVDRFPDSTQQWVDLWERFNARLSGERLNQLSQDVCQLMAQSAEDVTNFLFPTVTPTRLPVTATPSVIAGVPVCITSRFPSEAQEYARIWQDMSDGLTDEEKDRLELLVCENLTGQSSQRAGVAAAEPSFTSQEQVVTVDIHTGLRQVSSFIPPLERPFTPNFAPVAENFRLAFGQVPNGKISPNGEYLAIWSPGQFIQIYRMNQTNQQIALQPTNTPITDPNQRGDGRVVSLRPTATQGYTFLGDIRPTLTPTVTPTSPPRVEVTAELVARDFVEEVCPYTNIFTLDNPPPDYAATGRIIVDVSGQRRTYVLEPETGSVTWDDTLPPCLVGGGCNMSEDAQWMFTNFEGVGLVLSRPDYSEPRLLFYPEQLALIGGFQWVNRNILQYTETLLPNAERRSERQITHRIDPDTLQPVTLRDRESISINELSTEVVAWQPLENQYAVVRTSFNTGRGTGYRYFIYDAVADEPIYLARFADESSNMEFVWHPLGTILWYRYPGEREWYSFNPDNREQRIFGELPNGSWSRDYRWRLSPFNLNAEQLEERIENGQPVPTVQLWDSETGRTRLYCLPGFEREGLPSQPVPSPDSRYLAFQGTIPADKSYPDAPFRTFVLDLQTGSVTELTTVPDRIYMWLVDEGEWR